MRVLAATFLLPLLGLTVLAQRQQGGQEGIDLAQFDTVEQVRRALWERQRDPVLNIDYMRCALCVRHHSFLRKGGVLEVAPRKELLTNESC